MAVIVDIEISEDGTIKIEPTGYKNNQCMADLKELESHLLKAGIKTQTTDQKLKAESYVKTTTRARNNATR